MGAITAAALAADYPELVGALLLEVPPLRNAVAFDLPAGFMEARRREFAALGAMSPEQRTAKGAALNPGWHALEIEPWREVFARIRCPGLLITGDPDKMAIVTPAIARDAVALWQGGEVAHMAGAGHCIHRDRYAETMAAIDAFFSERRVAGESRPLAAANHRKTINPG